VWFSQGVTGLRAAIFVDGVDQTLAGMRREKLEVQHIRICAH